MTSTLLIFALVTSLLAALGQAQTIAPDTEFRVKLIGALSTETNRKGDKITAQVVIPREFAGAMMEGEVKDSKSGGKVNGKSVLNFTFQSLVQGDKTIPIQSQVKSFTNSKGQQNVDEEGRIIQKKSNFGKAALGTGIGAVIGGLAGGAKGAVIGAGIGGAASLILIQVAAKGANISFAPGSEVLLSVKENRRSQPQQ
jgi:hypothetical protein